MSDQDDFCQDPSRGWRMEQDASDGLIGGSERAVLYLHRLALVPTRGPEGSLGKRVSPVPPMKPSWPDEFEWVSR